MTKHPHMPSRSKRSLHRRSASLRKTSAKKSRRVRSRSRVRKYRATIKDSNGGTTEVKRDKPILVDDIKEIKKHPTLRAVYPTVTKGLDFPLNYGQQFNIGGKVVLHKLGEISSLDDELKGVNISIKGYGVSHPIPNLVVFTNLETDEVYQVYNSQTLFPGMTEIG